MEPTDRAKRTRKPLANVNVMSSVEMLSKGGSSFALLPPEINSGLMFSGAGSGPMLAAASAWDSLAAELNSSASNFGSVTSGMVSSAWASKH